MKKTITFILTLAIVAVMTSKTDASVIESAVKNLDSSLSQLVTAKDEVSSEKSLSPEEDLAFRKKVVNDALVLSFGEIEEIKSKLESFKFEEKSRESDLRKGFFADLGEFEASYRDLQGRLDKETDVEKIKDVARYAKEYREETYSPVITNILDFILTFQTNKLAENAGIRYEKIETDIKKLEKAGFIEIGYFGRQMGEARKFISDAKESADKARSIVTKEDSNKEEAENSEDIDAKTPPTPRELCEDALVNLKSGYNTFVDISGSVKKILKL